MFGKAPAQLQRIFSDSPQIVYKKDKDIPLAYELTEIVS